LISVDQLLQEDDPENDGKVAKITIDFMKRLEINSDRLTDLQQRVEGFHSKLLNFQSNNGMAGAAYDAIQETMHVLEGERKVLRNLQRLHYDSWKSAKVQYMQWSPDGDDIIDNDDDCEDPIILMDPKKRTARWNSMVRAAVEIQARHAMTIEQMSEVVIRLKALRSGGDTTRLLAEGGDHSSFDSELEELYETVCAFLRCRMTQQLLCQHLMAMGKDALGTSVPKKSRPSGRQTSLPVSRPDLIAVI